MWKLRIRRFFRKSWLEIKGIYIMLKMYWNMFWRDFYVERDRRALFEFELWMAEKIKEDIDWLVESEKIE